MDNHISFKKIFSDSNFTIYGIADVDASSLEIPFIGRVRAGFPSPATDFEEDRIDLNKELIKNPLSTFFVKVEGDSLSDLGIFDGDTMLVDKSLEIMKLYQREMFE